MKKESEMSNAFEMLQFCLGISYSYFPQLFCLYLNFLNTVAIRLTLVIIWSVM
jgi:hypothetical protein